jgi:hypothetical protein
MQKIFKCQTCGLDKTLESKTKEGKVFMSCPNWRDDEHKKARDDWKRSQGAPAGTYNAPVTQKTPPTSSFASTPDVYDLLTTLVAKVNKIYDKLCEEMPTDPFNEV